MSIKINYLFAIAITFVSFLQLPQQAQAATFTLPPQLSYEGLTFQSTFFDHQITLPIPKNGSVLSFFTAGQFKNTHAKNKLALISTNMLTSKDNQFLQAQMQPTITNAAYPTPTLYLHPTYSEPTSNVTEPTTTPPLPTPTVAKPTTPIIPTQGISTPSLANPGGLNPEKLFSIANTYRQSKGLAPFQKDERACSLAASRAPEINAEIAQGRMHSGLRARNLPYWNTENIISMNSEEAAFNWWINDTIHREAIEGNYTYSCVACSGDACAQEFTNFQPK